MSASIPFRIDDTRDGGSGAPRPAPPAGRGYPSEWHTLYDWALVWRYWHGQAQGLRKPYPLEARALLELGRGLSDARLADKLGLHLHTIEAWRAKYSRGS